MAVRDCVYVPPDMFANIREVVYAENPLYAFHWDAWLVSVGQTEKTQWFVNRGRTAAGVTVYWTTPNQADGSGTFYPYTVPAWGDIVDVVVVGQYVR